MKEVNAEEQKGSLVDLWFGWTERTPNSGYHEFRVIVETLRVYI